MAMATSMRTLPLRKSTSRPLGSHVDRLDVLALPAACFRLEFIHDIHAREMRWVLFTATQRGAIGKLVFTLEPNNAAHIKSISVQSPWRGRGLARMLYLACLSTLAELQVGELQLEAEEDTKRHGRLVGMYERWGFHTIPEATVLFLYCQNDCFRRVPMSFALGATRLWPIATPQPDTWFCMLTLTTPDGTCLVASEDGAIEASKEDQSKRTEASLWQTLLGRNGEIFLRSVHGKFLCAEDSGAVLADRMWNSTWETFQVVPFQEDVDSETIATTDVAKTVEEPAKQSQDGGRKMGGVALKNFHGSYLCLDANGKTVVSSCKPVPWDGGDIMSLVCNTGDRVPLYVKIMRQYQTQAFVQAQIDKYGSFDHASMSIEDAWHALMALTGDSASPNQSWLLHHLLAMAERAREDGHPDWFQLMFFLRGLGMLFLLWTDEGNEAFRNISASEWMVLNSTWIMGQAIPDRIEYPEMNALNADQGSDRPAMERCGITNASLPWTPDEYLFRVLEHNNSTLPIEALQAIRLWSLRVWYQQDCYEEVCVPADDEIKDWMREVTAYWKLADVKTKRVDPAELMPYYLGLAHKYLPSILQW